MSQKNFYEPLPCLSQFNETNEISCLLTGILWAWQEVRKLNVLLIGWIVIICKVILQFSKLILELRKIKLNYLENLVKRLRNIKSERFLRQTKRFLSVSPKRKSLITQNSFSGFYVFHHKICQKKMEKKEYS